MFFLLVLCEALLEPSLGRRARGTALDRGCRVMLSAVPAVINLLVRGSYAFIFDSA